MVGLAACFIASAALAQDNFPPPFEASKPLKPPLPQWVVDEPLDVVAEDATLSLRTREIESGIRTGAVPWFADPANLRGVSATQVKVTLAGDWSWWQNHQALSERLRARAAGVLRQAGFDVPADVNWRGSGSHAQLNTGHGPALGDWPHTSQAFLIPRRPFLGEEPDDNPWPVTWNQPMGAPEDQNPGLNRLEIVLTPTVFLDGEISVMSQAVFFRQAAGGHNAYPGAVWASGLSEMRLSRHHGPEHLWLLCEEVLRQWRLAHRQATAEPQLLPDAAHLPGPHRLPPQGWWSDAPGADAAISPLDQNEWLSPPHGLDNHLCGGAGRRWSPAGEDPDPCLRYPQE